MQRKELAWDNDCAHGPAWLENSHHLGKDRPRILEVLKQAT